MNLFTREGVSAILSLGPTTVKFTKVDGTERVMHCTTAPYLIPDDKAPVNLLAEYDDPLNVPKPLNEKVLRVFDLDVNDWRSFRVASLKEVSPGILDAGNQFQLLLDK